MDLIIFIIGSKNIIITLLECTKCVRFARKRGIRGNHHSRVLLSMIDIN